MPQPLSTRLAPAEERAILALSEPPVVIGLPEGASHRSTTVAELRRLGAGEGELTTEIGPSWKAPTSGGSTGPPKIILSGAGGAFNPFDMEAWGLRPGEQSLVTAPVHHNVPFSTAMTTLFNGGTVTLLERFDAERVLSETERRGSK